MLRTARDLVLYGGREFTPRDLPGLRLWLRGNDGVQARGASGFAAASSQDLSVADSAALSTGDIDFWVAGWMYLASDTGNNQGLIAKWAGGGANREYRLYYSPGQARFRFGVSSDGAAEVAVNAEVLGAPSLTTWYFVIAYHDSVNNLIGISVNGGAFTTASHTTGVLDTGSSVLVGNAHGSGEFTNGRVAHVVFAKNPPAGGAAVWSTIRDALYSGGNGLDVGMLSAAQRTAWGVVSAWRLQESGTGTRADSFGGNTLTNNNSVSGADGPFYVHATDGDPIARWADLSGRGNHATQATAAARPSLQVGGSGINNKPIARLDNSDDYLVVPKAVLEGLAACSIFVVAKGAAGAEHRLLADYNTVSASERQFLFRLDSGNTLTFHFGGVGSNVSSTSSTTYTFTNAQIFEGLALAGSNIRLFVDGVEAAYTAQAAAVALLASLTENAAMGAFYAGGNVTGNVDIAEVIVCGFDIGPVNRARVRQYLKRLWGTA